jgi:hypothetical protein
LKATGALGTFYFVALIVKMGLIGSYYKQSRYYKVQFFDASRLKAVSAAFLRRKKPYT